MNPEQMPPLGPVPEKAPQEAEITQRNESREFDNPVVEEVFHKIYDAFYGRVQILNAPQDAHVVGEVLGELDKAGGFFKFEIDTTNEKFQDELIAEMTKKFANDSNENVRSLTARLSIETSGGEYIDGISKHLIG